MPNIFLVLLISFFISSCSHQLNLSEENFYSKAYSGLEQHKTVLIAAVKADYAPLSSGEVIVFQELKVQLENNGWKVFVTDNKHRKSVFFNSVAVEASYAAVIFPQIVMKYVESENDSVYWDGVQRKYSNTNSSGSAGFKLPASSLKLEVYGSDGEWLFTSFGGLVLPRTERQRSAEPIRSNNGVVTTFDRQSFEKTKFIKQGVSSALLPIIQHELTLPIRSAL